MRIREMSLVGLGQEAWEDEYGTSPVGVPAPEPVQQEPGIIDQIKMSWDMTEQWKRQAVIAGAVSAMTFFWVSRLHKKVFGRK